MVLKQHTKGARVAAGLREEEKERNKLPRTISPRNMFPLESLRSPAHANDGLVLCGQWLLGEFAAWIFQHSQACVAQAPLGHWWMAHLPAAKCNFPIHLLALLESVLKCETHFLSSLFLSHSYPHFFSLRSLICLCSHEWSNSRNIHFKETTELWSWSYLLVTFFYWPKSRIRIQADFLV